MADERCVFCGQTVKPADTFCPECSGQLILQEKYRLVRRIHEGRFTAVFEAVHRRLHQMRCVVKIIEHPLHESESQVLSKYASETNFVPYIFDKFTDRARTKTFIVMEYVEGKTLKDTDLPWSAEKIVVFLDAMLGNLSKLHEADESIIHRDIKPANIIQRQRDGSFCLLDFGISKQGSETKTDLRFSGTEGYASPEQVTGGRCDARSDLYSLGATVYKLLTGETPPSSDSRLTKDNLVPPRRLRRAAVPFGLERVVLHLMAVKPAKRPASCREAQDLLKIRTSSGRWKLFNALVKLLDNMLVKIFGSDFVKSSARLMHSAKKYARKIPFLGTLSDEFWRSPYLHGGLAFIAGAVLTYMMLGVHSTPVKPLPATPVAVIATATTGNGTDTATPTFVNRPEPTLPPSQASCTVLIGLTDKDPLRLRAEPSTAGRIDERLSYNTMIKELTKSDDGKWIKVQAPDGKEGWISNGEEFGEQFVDCGTALLYETFDDPNRTPFAAMYWKGGTYGVNNGVYLMTSDKSDYAWGYIDGTYGDASITVEATLTGSKDSTVGLIFRYQHDDWKGNSLYMFEIYGTGYYRLRVRKDGKWADSDLVEKTFSPGIKGLGQINILRVETEGNRIRLFANGTRLSELTDNTFTQGGVALAVGPAQQTSTEPPTVRFDNLLIRARN